MTRLLFCLMLLALPAQAQEKVEITSQTLDLTQAKGEALFVGDVKVLRGEMRLNADQLHVAYDPEGKDITHMIATGSVVIATPQMIAEAAQADYDLATQEVVLTGDVLVKQGANISSGSKLVYHLDTDNAVMTGGVRSVVEQK